MSGRAAGSQSRKWWVVGGGWRQNRGSGEKGNQRRTTGKVGPPKENFGACPATHLPQTHRPHTGTKPEVAPDVCILSPTAVYLSFCSLVRTLDHCASMKTQLSPPTDIYMTRDYTAKYSVLAGVRAVESRGKVSDFCFAVTGRGSAVAHGLVWGRVSSFFSLSFVIGAYQ